MSELAPNVRVERELLGLLIQYPSVYDDVRDILAADAFEASSFQAIYASIAALRADGIDVTEATLASRLRGTVKAADLVKLAMQSVPPSVAIHHAQIIVQHAIRRRARSMMIEGMRVIREEDADVFDFVQYMRSEFDAILDQVSISRAYRHISAIGDDALALIDNAIDARASSERFGVTTGFIDVDRRIGAFMPGDYVVVGARPGMGKTAYAMCVTERGARMGIRYGWFSLEMPAEQLIMRSIAAESGVPVTKIRVGDVDAEARRVAMTVIDRLRDLPVWMDDDGSHTIQRLTSRARTMIRREKLNVIVVDYMGLVDNPSDTHEREMAGISKALKRLAKSEGVVVVALSQLSRQVENRAERRPQLSDLRYSGGIEQDADCVQFLYRPEYYEITTDEGGLSTEGVAEVITAKYRHGATGTDRLYFDKARVRFGDIAEIERFSDDRFIPTGSPF